MEMLTSKEIFRKAKEEGFALGAFNAGNLEILKAIVTAAQNQQTAVIVETSAGEATHFGMKNFLDVVKNFRQETGLLLFTNFDHAPGIEEAEKAIEMGYDLVHFDGASLPYEENVKITKALVEKAHQRGVLVEGEIDKIPGESFFHHEKGEQVQAQHVYTDPHQAFDFVKQTGVDLLAVFVGNLHGTYSQPPTLNLSLLATLARDLPCFLSLHGGSGLRDEEIQEAVKLGVVKVNVNTELRLAYRQTLENVLRGSDELAIYQIMPPVMAAVQKVVEEKIRLFKLT